MAAKKKVYCTRRIPEPGMNIMKANVDFKFWDSDEAIPYEELLKNVPGLDGLLCMLTDKVDAKVFETAGANLRVVSTMSVGYEHIDLDAARKNKVICCNTPNVSTDSVAEMTITLLLFVTRRFSEGLAAAKKGEYIAWKPTYLCGHTLFDSVAGVYGMGRIGFGVACRLKPFGVKKLIYCDVVKVSYADDIQAEYREFDDFLAESDFICICCNLTPQTRNKFNAAAFKKMKKSAILVNTGRGGVIHHDDLYDALKTGEIWAVGMDVTEPEPLPKDHKLLTLKNCVVAPHMGSNTWDTRNLMAETAANNIVNVFAGKKALGEIMNM